MIGSWGEKAARQQEDQSGLKECRAKDCVLQHGRIMTKDFVIVNGAPKIDVGKIS